MTAQAADAPLKEIPSDAGWPIVGHTIKSVTNPIGFGKMLRAKLGPYYRVRSFGQDIITLSDADANEFVLTDKDEVFSSELGWAPWLGRLFPRGLMLLDFSHHRMHRKRMNGAFKTAPMKLYLETLNDYLPERIKAWGEKGSFKFYPAIKELTLDVATKVFLGLEPGGAEGRKVNQALTDMVQASVALVRVPLPFTQMRKGVKAREFVSQYLRDQIPQRRETGGTDMFSQLCLAEDDDGTRFTEQEIVDHMIFLWMAAHDTVTSSMSTLTHRLGQHPEWQEKLRQEIAALGMNDDRLQYEMLPKMELAEASFKESLRINPPVPSMPRKVLKDTEFKGYKIPKGAIVGVSPLYTHRSEEIWGNPLEFDPMRFLNADAKTRHRFAWIPYGGGAHMCLGLHFAVMQAKAILTHLLPKFDIVLEDGGETEFKIMPLIRPKNDLPIRLDARS